MSYVVQCWERPFPDTLKAAAALNDQLCDATGPEPAVFAQLREALRRALREDPAFAGQGFDGLDDGAPEDGQVLSLGIPSMFIDALQPLLVREALALGLVVFDDQEGVCYHPLKGRLTHEGPEPIHPAALVPHPLRPAGHWLAAERDAQAAEPNPKSRAWIAQRRQDPAFQEALLAKQGALDGGFDSIWLQARLLKRLGPWFVAQGFVEISVDSGCTEFIRATEGGLQHWSVQLFLWGSTPAGSGPGFSIRCQLTPWLPAALAKMEGNGFPLVLPPHERWSWAKPKHKSDIMVLVQDRATLERLLDDYRFILDDVLGPLLTACRTPQGILAIARQQDDPHNPLVPTAALMKLVHWEGAPDSQALMLRLQQRMRKHEFHPAMFVWAAARLRASPETFGTMRPS